MPGKIKSAFILCLLRAAAYIILGRKNLIAKKEERCGPENKKQNNGRQKIKSQKKDEKKR